MNWKWGVKSDDTKGISKDLGGNMFVAKKNWGQETLCSHSLFCLWKIIIIFFLFSPLLIVIKFW